MAGRGPAPKPPERRVRHGGADAIPLRVIHVEPVAQPELPTVEIEVDGALIEFVWPNRTREWWQMWADSPLSAQFTATDWSELLDAALLHARYWRGDARLASELRLRVAKFGATPEDRARLRIIFAEADQADEKRDRKGAGASPSRQRRGPFRGDAAAADGA